MFGRGSRGVCGGAEVERDSPAWKAGLRRGEYISHVGKRRVSTPAEFYEAVAELKGDVRLRLTAGSGEAAIRVVMQETVSSDATDEHLREKEKRM